MNTTIINIMSTFDSFANSKWNSIVVCNSDSTVLGQLGRDMKI